MSDAAKTAVKFTGAARNLLIGAGALIAGASVIDIAKDISEQTEVKKQQRIQERNQRRSSRRSRKYNYAGTGYEPETFSGFVQHMFNQRTGHHKMGNSRF